MNRVSQDSAKKLTTALSAGFYVMVCGGQVLTKRI